MQAINKDRASLMSCHHHPQDRQQPSSRATSAQDHALCIVHSRASSSRATSSRAISSKAFSSRATSSRATSSRAVSSRAFSSKATSSRATSRGQWKDLGMAETTAGITAAGTKLEEEEEVVEAETGMVHLNIWQWCLAEFPHDIRPQRNELLGQVC